MTVVNAVAEGLMPVIPPTIVSALLVTAIFAPLSTLTSVDLYNVTALAAFGTVNYCFAFLLFIAGARRIPAAEAALILTLEIVMTPTWVWLLFGEKPSLATLLGGAVIFGTVLWHTMTDVRSTASSSIGHS